MAEIVWIRSSERRPLPIGKPNSGDLSHPKGVIQGKRKVLIAGDQKYSRGVASAACMLSSGMAGGNASSTNECNRLILTAAANTIESSAS